MNKIRLIFKNMSWLAISQVITSILAFFWTILIARYLGVSDYGIFGFAISLSGMFAVCCDLGINTHVVRSIATDYDIADRYLGNAIPLKLLLSIGYFVIIYILLVVWNSSNLVIYVVMLFVLECVLKNFTGLFHGVFQAHEKGIYQGIANILLAVFSFVLIVVAIYFNTGLEGISWAYVIANVIFLGYTTYALLKHIIRPKFQFDFDFWKKLLVWGIPFALTGIFYTIYYSIDIVMLTQMVGDFATGIYNATYKLINVLTLFYGIYTAVIFPVMSKLYKSESSLLVASFEKSTKYLTMVTVPICIGCLFYSTDIIQFIYGHQYDQAGVVLQILIWTVCFLFINGAASTALNASHKEYSVTKIYLAAAVFNVVLNFFLIPKYSYIGASIATVLSDMLILVLASIALKKLDLLPGRHLVFDIVKICISSAGLGIVLFYLKLNMWIAIPVSIAIYIIFLILTRTFDDGDKYIIRQILGN
ncbi:MAG: flippase [Methanobrevibacter sp.]|uniref:flippase n=1 Tax=Methanobrevibacter sp. TaxID=66852 RepID=UPI0026DF4B1F|nr:flippase [Methanobrevibacter sp.]MDO5849566.1 flippase [Methanobrevibacter sp.]